MRPSVAPFHANLAEAYRALGQYDRAVGCCRTALTLWKDYPEAHNNLGLALQALGQMAEAAEHYEAALALRPGDAQTHSNLGTALRTMGQVEKALEHFKGPSSSIPSWRAPAPTWASTCSIWAVPKRLCRTASRPSRLSPTWPRPTTTWATPIAPPRSTPRPGPAYFEALRINPDLAQSHVNLGLTLQQEGRADEAPPWFRRATEIEPKNLQFWGQYADLLTELERHPETPSNATRR